MQHITNRQLAWTCANCFRFLGGIEDQIEHAMRTLTVTVPNFTRTTPAPALIPCNGGCGEVYCTTECRDEAFKKHHRLLCVGKPYPQFPLNVKVQSLIQTILLCNSNIMRFSTMNCFYSLVKHFLK